VYLRAFKRARPIICLSDARLATHSVDQRKLWADWLAEDHPRGRARLLDPRRWSCSTLRSLRTALIAVNWITPAKVPQHVVGSVDEALDECRKLAERHSMLLPAHVFGQIRLWIEAGRRRRRRPASADREVELSRWRAARGCRGRSSCAAACAA
jgi:hypothetical protein